MKTKHYSKEKLDLYRHGELSILGRMQCAAHLKECELCRKRLDELREDGIKAGALRVRFFRPFPRKELAALAKGKRGAAVLDRSASIGGTSPLAAEVRSALYSLEEHVPVQEYIFGLGGRDFYAEDAHSVFDDLIKGRYTETPRFIGLLEKDDKNERA